MEFSKDLPNILVGINDSGKTTILRALGLLLGDKFNFNYKGDETFKSDISNTVIDKISYENIFNRYSIPIFEYEINNTIILAKFALETDEIDEDSLIISNQLLWCLEKSSDDFWICKSYSSLSNDESLHILLDDTDDDLELWNLSDTNLNKKINEYSVTKEDIINTNNTGRFKKIEKIRAIYSKTSLVKSWKQYKGFKTDKEIFPKYRYLDWNMNLNDLNELINDTMSDIVDNYKMKANDNINELSEEAETEINKELEKFKEGLFTDIPNVEEIQVKFKFNLTDELKDILIKKSNTDEFIHIESQGEGVKRRIWFTFIKWNALKVASSTDNIKRFIWCFDEPETHLYPVAQREFFDIIKKLSSSKFQTLLSTHSTIFTDKSKLECIKNVSLIDKYTNISQCNTVDDIFQSLQLKNSDFLFYNKFLAVEGDTEEILIPHLYKIYTSRTLIDDGIQLVKLNSQSNRIVNFKILENVMKDFKKIEDCLVFILDNDVQFDDRSILNKPYVKLIGKQDIEDSIDNNSWLSIIKNELNLDSLINEAVIQNLKNEIPNNIKITKEKKFYKRLQIILRKKKQEISGEEINYDLLPDKGKALGELLVKYINDINKIDFNIKEAFDLLKK